MNHQPRYENHSLQRRRLTQASHAPTTRLGRWVTACLVSSMLFGISPHAVAVERACGSDPIANTASVLCAPPSGPCTSTEVTLGANLEVPSSGCKFDLGGRSLRVTKTMQMVGTGYIVVDNAGDIEITGTGKLKARGDFAVPSGQTASGGLIKLVSSRTLSVSGRLEASGDGAGVIQLLAIGPVTLENGAVVQANGLSTASENGDLFADGGQLSIVSSSDTVTIDGTITLVGQNHGTGGSLSIEATRDILVSQAIEAAGGGGGGGNVELVAGDDIIIARPIDVDSRTGGASGGTISIRAGDDRLVGEDPGGSVIVENTRLESNGSPPEGDGGIIEIEAAGVIHILGTSALVRANAGTGSDGNGGIVALAAGNPSSGSASTFDLFIEGQLLAGGGSGGGRGGQIVLSAGRHLSLDASTDVRAPRGGAVVQLSAGGSASITRAVEAYATDPAGTGATLSLSAGLVDGGTLTVGADLLASGGTASSRRPPISITACSLVVLPGIKIEGNGGTGTSGTSGGASIILGARQAISLQNSSRVSAAPNGSITLLHPSGLTPGIGQGVVLTPAITQDVTSLTRLPTCAS